MSEYARAERAPTEGSGGAHASPQRARADMPFAPRALAPARQDATAESLNRSARMQSLAQTRQMLHDGPRMQAQRALQRALNPGFGEETAQREAMADEEELAQAKFEPAQRQAGSAAPGEEEEDETRQGWFTSVQRQPMPEEDEILQGAPVQRQPALDEEDTLQEKSAPVQREPALESEPMQRDEPHRTGLPDNLKAGVEALSGFSLGGVRVHYNSPQPAQLHALAYAQGSDIHVGPGEERHLPHEAWHVVQQMQGRVQPTLQAMGVAINDDKELETEADAMGARADREGMAGAEQTPAFASETMQLRGQMVPIQRYRNSVALGGKVSNGNNLLLRGPFELYAADPQFVQANSIGGEVEFHKGVTVDVVDKTLARVLPRAKADSHLAGVAAGYNEKADREFIIKDAKKTMPERAELVEQLRAAIREEWRSLNAEGRKARFGTSDSDDLIEMLEQQADETLAKAGTFDKSEVAARIQQYFVAQKVSEERPLMYSDCKGLAIAIAGFHPDEGEETDEIAPGIIYEYKERPEKEAVSAWSFHYATIIMTDGTDHVTMENAGAKKSEGFKKQTLDRTWFFEMYGAEQGQSFGEKYGPDFGD